MTYPALSDDPVIIGGLGGSGTRVLAEMVRGLSFDLGITNHANDELWAALLLFRPQWVFASDDREVHRGLHIYEKFRHAIHQLRPADVPFVVGALIERLVTRYNYNQSFLEKVGLAENLLPGSDGRHQVRASRGWGFKNPPSHILLEHLAAHFPQMKYIHLIRHGLDMAFSDNQNQLLNWGPKFGVDAPGHPDELPQRSVEYWVAANKRAIDLGRELLDERFLLVKFEELCAKPSEVSRRLADFLEVEMDEATCEQLAACPRTPASKGRYRDHDITIFPDELLAAVESLGFTV